MRVVVDGTWGFASHVDLTPERAAATAERAVGVARALAPLARERVERAAEPVHAGVEWCSDVRGRPARRCPLGEKVALLADRSRRLLAAGRGPRRGRARRRAGEQVLRRPGRHLDAAAAGAHRAVVLGHHRRPRRRRVRDHELARPARGARLGVPHRHRVGLGRRAGPAARVAGREGRGPVGRARPVRPGDRPVQPVADHPRVGRARHRVRPGHRLRGRVRGHQLRHAGPARHACATARRSCTSPATARSRTAWRPSATTTTVSPPAQWDLVRDGILVGYQLDRTFAPRLGLARSNGCAFADSPHHVPLQRMANVSLQPDARRRPVDGRPDRRRGRRDLRRRATGRGRSTCSGRTSSSPASGSSASAAAGSPGSCATSPTRR